MFFLCPMGTNTENARNLCTWLEAARTKENYAGMIQSFNQPGCFRAMPRTIDEKNKLYRCRKHRADELEVKFSHSNELGYRRKFVNEIGYGRCNQRKQSVLYLTHHRDTALVECLQDAKQGEIYTMSIGQWSLLEPIPVMYVPQPHREKRKLLSEIELGEIYDKHVDEYENRYPGYREFSGIYFDYMNDKFKSEERGFSYQITAAYSNLCYEADEGKNGGIIYVSVAEKENFNIALKKDIEDEKRIILDDVFKIKLKVVKDRPTNYDTDLNLLDIEKCRHVKGDGTIIW